MRCPNCGEDHSRNRLFLGLIPWGGFGGFGWYPWWGGYGWHHHHWWRNLNRYGYDPHEDE